MSSTNGGNGAPGPQGQAPGQPQGAAPQLNVIAQYIKDLSFENPNATRAMTTGQQQPAINIQVSVNANPLTDTDIEVVLKIDGKAELPNNTLLFGFELAYAGTFRIQNVPQESIHAIVMIECPRLLFPFARQIIADTVISGGFPPLLLDPVDFVGLYRQNMAKMQPAGAAPAQA
jgi:preprotein translocase subunit SecB